MERPQLANGNNEVAMVRTFLPMRPWRKLYAWTLTPIVWGQQPMFKGILRVQVHHLNKSHVQNCKQNVSKYVRTSLILSVSNLPEGPKNISWASNTDQPESHKERLSAGAIGSLCKLAIFEMLSTNLTKHVAGNRLNKACCMLLASP